MESGSHIRLIMSRAAKAFERVDRASIAGTGLNFSDFAILESLLHKGPLPINRIGEKVLLTSGSMTTAVNRLGERGLVRRVQDTSDGRCFHLHLTAGGRRLIEAAYRVHAANLERLAAVLSVEERGDLVRLLKKIGRHAERIDLG
jgi:MarR family transcriptional regulator, 2-MHQ and catechol-resistance regulon repressor